MARHDGAETARALQHVRHVGDVRNVLERDRLRGEQGRRYHGEGGILVARHAMHARNRLLSCYLKSIHV